jgi:hypothetical protein
MRKHLIRNVLAVVAGLGLFVAQGGAADPSGSARPPSVAGAEQPGAGPVTGLRRPGPTDIPRPDTRELPPILIIASVNPQAKNDPEVQKLLDKAIADLEIVQQDEAARNAAFGQFVQAERNGDADAIQKAHKDVSSANAKLVADARQFNQQDVAALRRRIHELMSHGGSRPETAKRPDNSGNPSASSPASASTN